MLVIRKGQIMSTVVYISEMVVQKYNEVKCLQSSLYLGH